ncbi:hypothetical protein GGS20DRAFT_540819 [Poronia punctata]|nr:hypothetical protein GGS20DRAFT_540819 [Poronia punctata]
MQQPLYLYARMPCIAARSAAQVCMRHSYGFGGSTTTYIIRHASSKAKAIKSTSSSKTAPKPLPFQPRARAKPQPEPEKQHEPPKRSTMKDLVRERWIYLLGSGAAVLCLGYFSASLIMYWRNEPAPCFPFGCEPEAPTGRPSIQSPYEFDLHLDKSEHRFGITKLRRELSSTARGHVLEVAVGTGRNFEFYNWGTVTESLMTPEEREKAKAKASSWLPSWAGGSSSSSSSSNNNRAASREDDGAVRSFTGVDISPGMLDIALRRIRIVVPHMAGQIPKKPSFAILAAKQHGVGERPQGHVVSFLSDRIRLLQSDVQSGLPAPPSLSASSSIPAVAPQKYDTILQTFGLCSVRDPVSLVSTMAASLQPETGRILLLEHGRSIWDLVNGLLDRGARGHYERFGCWWNRDIEVIVHEAARRVPGLEVLRLERPGWVTGGTHVVVELRVASTDGKSKAEDKNKVTRWGSIFPSLLSTMKEEDDDTKRKD